MHSQNSPYLSEQFNTNIPMSRPVFRIFLLFIFIVSCQDEKQDRKEEKKVPLRFEKESIVKKTGENCDTREYDCTIISLEVVRAKGPAEVSEEINQALDSHVISLVSSEEDPSVPNLERLANKFILDYRQAAENFSEEPPWEAYVNESVFLKTDSLVSIGVSTEIFTGGAHGYKVQTFLNFDPTTGKLYTQKGLFSPEFRNYVEKRFRKEHGIPAEENINSTGFWFENDSFHLPENIGFTKDNVILVYNSYEIAPYAAGDIYMEIPMEKVRPFLKFQ